MHDAFCRILRNQCFLVPHDRVLVAVSGGVDSVVLLHLFASCASRFPLTVFAAHLDHGLRPESASDADFVRALCARLEIPLVVERIDASENLRGGDGLEAAARGLRRDFLRRTAAHFDCAVIALGHHRDDQAETVLMRLLRGSGPTGLAAMRARSGLFIRPLLDWPRSQLRSYLEKHDLSYVEDCSNADPLFTRNRLRHEVLPLLRAFNPALDEHLAQLASQFSVEETYWDGEVAAVAARLCETTSDGVALPLRELLALHPALRTRLLRATLERVRGDLWGIGRDHLESIEGLLVKGRPQREVHLPRAWVARRYERVLIACAPPQISDEIERVVDAPGVYPLPGGGALEISFAGEGNSEAVNTVEFFGVSLPLVIRTMRPGDRFRPSGMTGHKKLKDFFIDEKIEHERRRRLPLVVSGEILWIVGVRRCEGFRPTASADSGVRVVFEPPPLGDNRLVKTEGLW